MSASPHWDNNSSNDNDYLLHSLELLRNGVSAKDQRLQASKGCRQDIL